MLRTVLRILCVAALLLMAVGYYYLLGAGPTPSERAGDLAWWRPRGWARQVDWEPLAPLQQIAMEVELARHEGRSAPRGLIPLALFALPPLLLGAAGFALFRGAATRTLLLAVSILLVAFSYYGWLDPKTWRDYSWRWPAVLATTSLFVSAFAMAPALLRDLLPRSAPVKAAVLLVFVGSVYFLSIEITGTNPNLRLNLSPWPALTLFGFLLFGLAIGVVHLSAGVGLAAGLLAGGAARVAVAGGVAGVVAVLLYRIPFATWSPGRMFVLMLAAALLAVLTLRAHADRRTARVLLGAGLVVLGAIKIGQWQGEWFLAKSRNEIAARVVAAVERYRADHGTYPEELRKVVPDYLPEIPLPRAGWFEDIGESFNYIDLGDSFLLEFPSVLWVQCAYSPAYREAEEEGKEPEVAAAADEAAAGGPGSQGPEAAPDVAAAGGEARGEWLAASWSCESKPPQLW